MTAPQNVAKQFFRRHGKGQRRPGIREWILFPDIRRKKTPECFRFRILGQAGGICLFIHWTKCAAIKITAIHYESVSWVDSAVLRVWKVRRARNIRRAPED